MMALGYTLVGILLLAGVVLASAIVAGLWLAVSAMRPELLERRPRGKG